MEAEFNHLNHATWECKYHVVFTPKYRKKLFGKIKQDPGQVFHDLARRKECRIEEGHLMPDHVHMLISIPPKYQMQHSLPTFRGRLHSHPRDRNEEARADVRDVLNLTYPD